MPNASKFSFPSLLWTSYFRYLKKNLWLFVLSLVAIATGVAVVLAIDVASVSAKRSFSLSLQALTGRSNYAITGAGSRIDESFYAKLRMELGYRKSAPVVEGYVSFPDLNEPENANLSTPLTLIGVDPLMDGAVRSWTGGQFQDKGSNRSSGLTNLIGSTDLSLIHI